MPKREMSDPNTKDKHVENEEQEKNNENPPLASPESASLNRRQKANKNQELHYSQTSASLRRPKMKPSANEKRRYSAPVAGFQKPEERQDRKRIQSVICEDKKEQNDTSNDKDSPESDNVRYYIGDEASETVTLLTNGSLKRPKPARRQVSMASVASQVSDGKSSFYFTLEP